MKRGLLASAIVVLAVAAVWMAWPGSSSTRAPSTKAETDRSSVPSAPPEQPETGQTQDELIVADETSGVLRGRVGDAESGRGVAGVGLVAFEPGKNGARRTRKFAVTNAEGAYAFRVEANEIVINAPYPHSKGIPGYAGGCLRHRFVVGPNEEVEAPPIMLLPRPADEPKRGRWGFAMNLPPHAPDHSELVVTWVDPGGVAELGGLKAGDQIVAANGVDLSGVRHNLVWGIVRLGDRLELTLKDGRSVLLPSRTFPGP